MALTGPFPVARNIRLAETDATIAPTSILPSSAILNIPLRSDRIPAIAPMLIGTASSRLPSRTPVRFTGFPARALASSAAIHGTIGKSSQRRHANDGPRTSCSVPTTAEAVPAMSQSIPTVVSSVKLSPPCSLIQNEKRASVPKLPLARLNARRPNTAKTAPRIRALRRALRAASPSPVGAMASVIAVIRTPWAARIRPVRVPVCRP